MQDALPGLQDGNSGGREAKKKHLVSQVPCSSVSDLNTRPAVLS